MSRFSSNIAFILLFYQNWSSVSKKLFNYFSFVPLFNAFLSFCVWGLRTWWSVRQTNVQREKWTDIWFTICKDYIWRKNCGILKIRTYYILYFINFLWKAIFLKQKPKYKKAITVTDWPSEWQTKIHNTWTNLISKYFLFLNIYFKSYKGNKKVRKVAKKFFFLVALLLRGRGVNPFPLRKSSI